MSAIAGIFNMDGSPVDRGSIQRMTDSVAHRGPDGVGHWVDGAVALGQLMLQTTPESLHEHQPLALDDGNYVITWDGRMDNRDEIVRALHPSIPVSLETPDSELVLRAYMLWGTACLERIYGDFAFAIWDGRLRQLFCARDPFGIRAFHYYYDQHVFVFGTEIKELLVDSRVPNRLNDANIGLYLTAVGQDIEETFYDGIYRLPGGYSLLVTPQGLDKRVYWAPNVADRIELASDEEYEAEFSRLFRQAVESRMRSCTPVGVFLSGGLDSSAVVCIAETLRKESEANLPELECFSYVFPNIKHLDESKYIQQVADRYRTANHLIPSEEFWGMKPFPARTVARDEPFLMPYEARTREVLSQARNRGVRVFLDGQGGDEVLGARYPYLTDLLRGLRLGEYLRGIRRYSRAARRRMILRGLGSMVPWHVRKMRAWFFSSDRPSWVDDQFARRTQLDKRLRQLEAAPKYHGLYLEEQRQLIEQRGRQIAFIWRDPVGAEFQIEHRHPFWDVRLVEFLTRIPPQQKYKDSYSKSILRRAMRGILPEQIRLRRDKTKFVSLFDLGIQEREAERLKELLRDPLLGRLGYVNASQLRLALEGFKEANDSEKNCLFHALILEEWLQENLGRQWVEATIEHNLTPGSFVERR